MNTTSNYDKVSQRAYQLWDNSGRPQGKETEHWLQAEKEIQREELQRRGKSNLAPGKAADSPREQRAYSM
jgi:hypothetical protein